MEVGQEDRLHHRAGAIEVGVQPDSGAPHLPMRALPAVDDIGDVADDDRVRVAVSGRLRVAAAAGAEEHRAFWRVDDERRAPLTFDVTPRVTGQRLVRKANSLECVGGVAHGWITLVGPRLSSARPLTPFGGFESVDD